MAKKDAVGRYGERLAQRHVEACGWDVLETNWHGQGGELDVVALDGDVLVVVEVKTRSGVGYGHPAEAVTSHKLARIKRLTSQWLARFRERLSEIQFPASERSEGAAPVTSSNTRRHFSSIRIDVIAVTLQKQGPAVIEHLKAVA